MDVVPPISETKESIADIGRQLKTVAEQYYSLINTKIKNEVIPYIQMLALAYMGNKDYKLAGIDKELLERFTQPYMEETSWYRQLNSLEE